MPHEQIIQLSQLIKNQDPLTILKEAKKIYCYHYSRKSFRDVKVAFKKAKKLFTGKFKGYKSCNTEYHDFEHTMETFLATTRLMDGYNINKSPLPETLASNLLIAALFHDAGYIQEDWDLAGSGAKHTVVHVERGIKFVLKHYVDFGLPLPRALSISRMIESTSAQKRIDDIQFESEPEKIAGMILGTSDLLGQMSNRAYLEKLLFLYYELKEASINEFATEFDILKSTVEFYNITLNKFKDNFDDLYVHVKDHFRVRNNIESNLYIDAINRQIAYLNSIIEDESTNFRHKLKRGEWVHGKEISAYH